MEISRVSKIRHFELSFTIDSLFFYDCEGVRMFFDDVSGGRYVLYAAFLGGFYHGLALEEYTTLHPFNAVHSLLEPNDCHDLLKSCLKHPSYRLKSLLSSEDIVPATQSYFEQFKGKVIEQDDK